MFYEFYVALHKKYEYTAAYCLNSYTMLPYTQWLNETNRISKAWMNIAMYPKNIFNNIFWNMLIYVNFKKNKIKNNSYVETKCTQ